MTPLRAWRARVGLSRVALAARLGVDASTVFRWEAGTPHPPYLWLALAAIENELWLPAEAPAQISVRSA